MPLIPNCMVLVLSPQVLLSSSCLILLYQLFICIGYILISINLHPNSEYTKATYVYSKPSETNEMTSLKYVLFKLFCTCSFQLSSCTPPPPGPFSLRSQVGSSSNRKCICLLLPCTPIIMWKAGAQLRTSAQWLKVG